MRRVCATVQAFAVLAALPLSAAELTHRWSFNGDYADAVGGTDAVKCGTYVSLYGGKVHMGYGECSHGTGYVDLGNSWGQPLRKLHFKWENPWGQALRKLHF